MRREIESLADAGPAPEELDRVRNLHAAGIASSLERVSERADRLSMYACLFDEPERINDETARYEAVGREEVRALLTTYARPDNQVVLTYVPAEAARPGPEADAAAAAEAAAPGAGRQADEEAAS
jgi:predicted Zn-dependent peptidase